MPELTNPKDDGHDASDSSIDPLIKAYIDEKIQKAQEDEEIPRKKKWKNSWRSASPITKGTFIITAAIATSTIAYTLISLLALGPMKESSRAAKDAAYASCISSQVARSTLIQYQNSAEDSRLGSIASYAQALVAMQGQKTFVDADFTIPGNRPYGRPLSLLVHLKNTGKSDASNISFTGWVIIAKPNSGATGMKAKKRLLFTVQKDSMRVGEQFLPDIPGTTREGNTHGMYVPAINATGDLFIDTAELDKAVFNQHDMAVFAFYTISYEDFTARYIRHVCNSQYSWGPIPTLW